jgi:hypothetical protein
MNETPLGTLAFKQNLEMERDIMKRNVSFLEEELRVQELDIREMEDEMSATEFELRRARIILEYLDKKIENVSVLRNEYKPIVEYGNVKPVWRHGLCGKAPDSVMFQDLKDFINKPPQVKNVFATEAAAKAAYEFIKEKILFSSDEVRCYAKEYNDYADKERKGYTGKEMQWGWDIWSFDTTKECTILPMIEGSHLNAVSFLLVLPPLKKFGKKYG